MTVSVLMPVYNAERYVSIAIDSALAQTCQDFELLLFDDGSTDGSLAILRRYEAKDPRIRVFSRENRGIVPTRNELVALSRGEYLAIMDADDISLPTRLEKQVAYLSAHPECVAVGSSVRLIDPEGWLIADVIVGACQDEIDEAHISGLGANRLWNPSVMMLKSAVERVGGYDEAFPLAEDLDLFLRLGEIGKLANLPDVLCEYRRHYANIGEAEHRKLFELVDKAVQAARYRRGLEPLPKRQRQARSPSISRIERHRRWAWRSLGAGNLRTARKHAWRALVQAPFSIESWRVLACVLRGH